MNGINQWIGLGISYLFIFGMIGTAQLLLRLRIVGAAATRKIVHIGVAHWWIIAMLWIDDLAVALIGPVSFIIINWISYRRHIFAAMEHEEPRKNLGTIYFPVALTALVALTWGGVLPRWYGLIAILVLGWGDGSASLLGEWPGRKNAGYRFSVPGGSKSVIGTTAMFIAAFAVTAVILLVVPGLVEGTAPVVFPRLIGAVSRLAGETWVARSTDSTVLVALSRLDGFVRLAAERVADLGATAVGDVGTTLSSVTEPALQAIDPARWTFAPSTALAIALIIASVATAIELLTPWGLDNLTIPFATIAVLSILLTLPEVWIVRFAWALGMNLVVAIGAFLHRSVTAAGAIAGAGVGLVIFLSGGGFYWSILIAFFVSSSVLGRVTPFFSARSREERNRRAEARRDAEAINAKGSRRDAVQVFANGGLAAIMAAAHALTGRPVFMFGFAIAIAAANADTWASEIGVLSRKEPVSILTFREIPRGTSGGISPLGLFAATGGALFIGLWFGVGYVAVEGWNPGEIGPMVAAITGGGFLGSVIDSVLGATVQAQYWDHHRERFTERRKNASGAANRLVRGFHLFTNDAVNAVSGIVSAAILIGLVA
ncbi:MAG: DUF92 domain-containing protein [Alkalispirochaeta sp.]